MFAQTWIEAVSMIFGTTTSLTAIIMSFLLIVLCDMITAISVKWNALEVVILLDLIMILLFVAIQWLPLFTGTVLAVVVSLIGASVIRDKVSR